MRRAPPKYPWETCTIQVLSPVQEERESYAMLVMLLPVIGIPEAYLNSMQKHGNASYRAYTQQDPTLSGAYPVQIQFEEVSYEHGGFLRWYRPSVKYSMVFEKEVVGQYEILSKRLFHWKNGRLVMVKMCDDLPFIGPFESDAPDATVTVELKDAADGFIHQSRCVIQKATLTPK